jgi:hypothetical protein
MRAYRNMQGLFSGLPVANIYTLYIVLVVIQVSGPNLATWEAWQCCLLVPSVCMSSWLHPDSSRESSLSSSVLLCTSKLVHTLTFLGSWYSCSFHILEQLYSHFSYLHDVSMNADHVFLWLLILIIISRGLSPSSSVSYCETRYPEPNTSSMKHWSISVLSFASENK